MSRDAPDLDPRRFPDRRSVRLPEHDYAGGIYSITLCTHDRVRYLSRIERGRVVLEPVGRIVHDEWVRCAVLRPGVWLDAFVLMPDHMHAIIGIAGEGGVDGGADRAAWIRGAPGMDIMPCVGARARAARPYLGGVIRGFKSACTRRCRMLVGSEGGRLWQRGYYEHVVRGSRQLERIRHYIAANPRRWTG